MWGLLLNDFLMKVLLLNNFLEDFFVWYFYIVGLNFEMLDVLGEFYLIY